MDFAIEKKTSGIFNISWGFPLTSFTGFEEHSFVLNTKDSESSVAYTVYCVLCIPTTSPVTWEPQHFEVQLILRKTDHQSNNIKSMNSIQSLPGNELQPRLVKGSLNYGEYVPFYQTSPGYWSSGWFKATFTRPSRTTPASWWVWHNRADIWMEFDVPSSEEASPNTNHTEEKDISFEKIELSKDSCRKESRALSQLADLLTKQMNCDVQFQFSGEKKIGAHKSILMARSPVFASLFKSSESTKSEIRVDDIDSTVFMHLLRFAYSSKLNEKFTDDLGKALFTAADKYEMDDLKEECVDFLVHHVTEDNALNLLVWSELVSNHTIKEAVTKFCCRHSLKICHLQQWENFAINYPKLCAILTRRMIQEVCDDDNV